MFNSSILITVSSWDFKRALDRLKSQKVHFNSGPTDVQLTLDALYTPLRNLVSNQGFLQVLHEAILCDVSGKSSNNFRNIPEILKLTEALL